MENKRYDKLRASFEATQPQLPADFTGRVMKRIEGQPSVSRPERRTVWLYPAIAVAASLLLLVMLHYRSEEPEKEGAMELLSAKNQDVRTPHLTEDYSVKTQSPLGREVSAGGLSSSSPPLHKYGRRQGLSAQPNTYEGVSAPKLVAPEPDKEAGEVAHVPESTDQEASKAVSVAPPERQALADIYLAEAALQVAYRRQAQAEALRAYVASFEEEEAAQAHPIIAF